jgi:hypothetical protein
MEERRPHNPGVISGACLSQALPAYAALRPRHDACAEVFVRSRRPVSAGRRWVTYAGVVSFLVTARRSSLNSLVEQPRGGRNRGHDRQHSQSVAESHHHDDARDDPEQGHHCVVCSIVIVLCRISASLSSKSAHLMRNYVLQRLSDARAARSRAVVTHVTGAHQQRARPVPANCGCAGATSLSAPTRSCSRAAGRSTLRAPHFVSTSAVTALLHRCG